MQQMLIATKQHLCSHLHLSNTVEAFLCHDKNGNEYDEHLEMNSRIHPDPVANKGTCKLSKPYVHSMMKCIKPQAQSNNAKDEEGRLTKNRVDNMAKRG